MIPRTKVNYSLKSLFKALFILESKNTYKKKLKKLLTDYFSLENILLTPSGRCGLYFILKAIDKKRVLIPAYTCKAVVEAVTLAGKEVVYVEVESDGFNMSTLSLETLVDAESVVIATHQFGIPCEIEKIVNLCHSRNALVIEDAAASLGTRVNGLLTGTFGDAAFFSFDSTKLINVPLKGGFIIVRDSLFFNKISDIYFNEIKKMPNLHKLKLLTFAFVMLIIEYHFFYCLFYILFFELRGSYTAEISKLNEFLTEFYRYDFSNWQAFIAIPQVEKINDLVLNRQRIYSKYLKELDSCHKFSLPPVDINSEWACIRFPIRVHANKFNYYKKAAKKGVDFAFSFTYICAPSKFSNANKLAESVLDLPFYQKLTAHEMEHVVRVLKHIEALNDHENQ